MSNDSEGRKCSWRQLLFDPCCTRAVTECIGAWARPWNVRHSQRYIRNRETSYRAQRVPPCRVSSSFMLAQLLMPLERERIRQSQFLVFALWKQQFLVYMSLTMAFSTMVSSVCPTYFLSVLRPGIPISAARDKLHSKKKVVGVTTSRAVNAWCSFCYLIGDGR